MTIEKKDYAASLTRATRLFNRFRAVAEAKGWKPGAVTARKSDETGELYIYQAIGAGWFDEGLTAQTVAEALVGMKGVKTLNVYVNSPGGDVFEAKSIYAQLQRFEAKKVGYVDGLAASAATFLIMACDEIITAPEATWMIHETRTISAGDADQLRADADLLDLQNADLAEIYSKRTGQPVDKVRELMAAETWMNSAQALELKFTDKVAGAEDTDPKALAAEKPSRAAGLFAVTQTRLRASAEVLQNRASRVAREVAERASPSQRAKPASR